MSKAPAFQWYPNDYLRDTRILSLISRGAWADMLNFMWYAEERGKLDGSREQFARQISCSINEIELILLELSVTKVADVTECNNLVTVINRRMYRDERERKLTRLRVQKHRNGKCNANSNDDETRYTSSSSSSSKKESIKKEKISFTENHFINIPVELMEKWKSIAPGISVQTEITKAEAWVLSNPKLKKSNWSRFLTNWIVRAQDHAIKFGGKNANTGSATGTGKNRAGFNTERERNNAAGLEEADRIAQGYYERKAREQAESGGADVHHA